jgi:hypothetical protein
MLGTTSRLLGVPLVCALLAGCGDGIEVNSKLLDSVGSMAGLGQKKETRLTERAGLVIPPTMAALPEPGSGDKVAAAVSSQLPQDPEKLAVQTAAQKKALKAKACETAKQSHDQVAEAENCEGLIAKIWGSSDTEQ